VLVGALLNKERTVPFGCGCACVRWYYPSMVLTGILFHRRSRQSPHTTKPRPGGWCPGPPRFWLVLSF
jgi:hypothetical protein